ncbi:YdcH family protein [Hwanghaeella sp.]|uniref:YdcH family protein n=1 Tax=Hwanghaeella sp. TaxID=2605943 RepID=UPI003CCBC250
MDFETEEQILHRMEELRLEHRDLDDVIARLSEEAPFDQLQVQRLKKRKLLLKDEMARLEAMLIPDIIA